MVDPLKVVKFDRTIGEKQEFLIFCIFVANKNAMRTAAIVNKFLEDIKCSPFVYVQHLVNTGQLVNKLKELKCGQYNRISKALEQVVTLNLDKVDREDLLKVHGIGLKTASYFVSCTQQDKKYMVLDTHITKALKAFGIADIKGIPPLPKYIEIEKKWLTFVESTGINSAEFDLEVWRYYAGHSYTLPENIVTLLKA